LDPVLPALDGASVAGLVPVLVGGAEARWLPPTACDADAVVLLVLDGLGWDAVQRHRAVLPTLDAMEGTRITTVVPSTTATALTSICTGLAPAHHGVLGYRMRLDGDVLNVLRWTTTDSHRPPDPFDVQRHDAFLGRPVPVITKSEFRGGGFTRAHLRGAHFLGWHTVSALIELCVRCVRAGERFVYAYYPGVDTVAHEFGLHDAVYLRELAFVDRLVGDLIDALPPGTALLVTSDHGQVHLEPDAWRELDAARPYVAAQAGDGRFRSLYARPGARADLLAAARDDAGDDAWVLTRAEILDRGLIGSGATGSVPGRLGDVVLAAKGPVAFVDPAFPNEAQLRSAHGSLTADEMYVPLLAATGRG
jgi:predicted AlkP superfamily pyrophosphatase or phosphodiesterase